MFELVEPFESAHATTIGHEGDFSDDPNDSGGATRFGVTENVARANGYDGPMSELPFELAKSIARTQFWDVLRLDDVAQLSAPLSAELFDTSYNMGPGAAGAFLQRALNVLNRRAVDYPDLRVDGLVGPMTLRALRAFLAKRVHDGESVLLKALNCLQGAGYIELAERREKDEKYVFGWLRARVSLQAPDAVPQNVPPSAEKGLGEAP